MLSLKFKESLRRAGGRDGGGQEWPLWPSCFLCVYSVSPQNFSLSTLTFLLLPEALSQALEEPGDQRVETRAVQSKTEAVS